MRVHEMIPEVVLSLFLFQECSYKLKQLRCKIPRENRECAHLWKSAMYSISLVSAHPYCARKFTCHDMHPRMARALSTKMNYDRADGH